MVLIIIIIILTALCCVTDWARLNVVLCNLYSGPEKGDTTTSSRGDETQNKEKERKRRHRRKHCPRLKLKQTDCVTLCCVFGETEGFRTRHSHNATADVSRGGFGREEKIRENTKQLTFGRCVWEGERAYIACKQSFHPRKSTERICLRKSKLKPTKLLFTKIVWFLGGSWPLCIVYLSQPNILSSANHHHHEQLKLCTAV